MNSSEDLATAFDVLLASAIVALAVLVLFIPGLYRAAVLFITFGLMLALAWVRLEAFDVALAEAAIGAGLLGALIVGAVHQIERDEQQPGAPGREREGRPLSGKWWRRRPPPASVSATVSERAGDDRETPSRSAGPLVLAVLVAAGGLLGALMVRAVIELSDERAGLAASVDARIEETGVTHPVTAVLLNFRAYDTWLEMVVLLAVAAAALGSRRGALLPEREGASPGAVLRGLAQRMAPMILLLAVFVLASGTTGPGGAFQAGALLAAGLFLLRLAGFPVFNQAHQSAWRVLLAVGVATFLLAALMGIALGGAPLRLSPDIAGTAIVLIEVTLTISVVAALFALLVGAVPEDEDHRSHEPDERQTGA